jgi:hypothetical protein
MSEHRPENESGLIIDPAVLADIQAQCQRRRAELEATKTLPPLTIAPGSTESAFVLAKAPSSIPLLESAFWQALLYGSPDALVPLADANTALRLVAHELSIHCNGADFVETVRAGVLRKALLERFGAKAWDVVNKLWRNAPASPGAPEPSEDQSQLPPGPLPVGRNQPQWIRELDEPGGAERTWRIENGLWGG